MNTVKGLDSFSCDFRRPTHSDGLRHSNIKVSRLINEPSGSHFVRFGRVDEVKTKEIFLITGDYMKAVSVIRRIRNQPAIFQHDPVSGLIPGKEIIRRAPNDNNDKRAYTDSRVDRKPRNQSGTSNWPTIMKGRKRSLKPF